MDKKNIYLIVVLILIFVAVFWFANRTQTVGFKSPSQSLNTVPKNIGAR